MKKALFAGTFDPVTKGHEKVIEKAVDLFDELYVSVGVNAEKKPIFSVHARLEMLKEVCKKYNNVKIVYNEGMLVDLMKKEDIKYNVRGVRNDSDYIYENNMHFVNEKLYPKIVTLFIPCEEEYVNISSTAVRKAVKENKNLESFVSKNVLEIINKELYKN